MHLSKQQLRALTIIIILFIFFLSGLFFYTNQKKTTARDIKLYQQFLSQNAKIQTSHFNHIKGITKQLSHNSIIKDILTTANQNPEKDQGNTMIATINKNLFNIASIPDISAAFIMNTHGTCILSSNATFLGKNYGFRPYFKQAISGNDGLYTAAGVTSKQLGIYYALPIRLDTQLLGVAVIKFSPSFFNLEHQISLNKSKPQKDQAMLHLPQ